MEHTVGELVKVIPYLAPDDDELAARVRMVADQVAKHGELAEQAMHGHAAYAFLNDTSDTHLYYLWVLYAARHGVGADKLHLLESAHTQRITSPACAGQLALTIPDEAILSSMLEDNTGSKETIRTIRKWAVERSHSLSAIAHGILSHILSTKDAMHGLHSMYVVNDIFHHRGSCQGPYTPCLPAKEVKVVDIFMPYLPCMLSAVCGMHEAVRDKCGRLVSNWSAKAIIAPVVAEILTQALHSAVSMDTALQAKERLCSPYFEGIERFAVHMPKALPAPAPVPAPVMPVHAPSPSPQHQAHPQPQQQQQQQQQQPQPPPQAQPRMVHALQQQHPLPPHLLHQQHPQHPQHPQHLPPPPPPAYFQPPMVYPHQPYGQQHMPMQMQMPMQVPMYPQALPQAQYPYGYGYNPYQQQMPPQQMPPMDQMQMQMQMGFFPPPPPPMPVEEEVPLPPSPPPVLSADQDPYRMPVGRLADIARSALKQGAAPYAPLDQYLGGLR